MLQLFSGLEHDIVLHAVLVAAGLATFVAVLLWIRCPSCSWAEWIGGRDGADDDQE